MENILHLRNADIARLLIGAPEGHSHIRTIIETVNGDRILLQEATVAAIVRGYTTVKTSPTVYAVEFESIALPERKKGYAEHQLIELGREEERVRAEISALLSAT
jgi:hypothetical protein